MDLVTIRIHGGEYRIHDPGGRIGAKIALGVPYEKRLLVHIAQRCYRGTAVDVGAHVGNHSLFLAAVCGLRVLAFECHQPTVERLCENLALNPHLKVMVHDCALSDEEGTGRLTGGRWVEFDPTRGDKGTLEPGGDVTVRRFDDLYTLDDLSVVKVDVEGTEHRVLAGMVDNLDRCSPDVYAETHTPEAHDATAAVLEPLGYRMTRAIHMGSVMERWQR